MLQAQQAFAEAGDSFTTPRPRLPAARAAAVGRADLASSGQQQGYVLPSMKVAEPFDAALPSLVAPDAA